MLEVISVVGALLGPAIGFGAVWWQQKRHSKQHIRDKCAELIYLGDQSANARENNPDTFPEVLRTQHNDRMNQVEPLLRYLELSAPKRIFTKAGAFVASTEKMGLTYHAGASPKISFAEYQQARSCLVRALKR